MSEIYFLIILCISLLLIYGLYKYMDKMGLYCSLVILNIITFILTFKITNIFRMNINLNIASYLATLSIFYIYLIRYGKKDIKNLIDISIITNVTTSILIVIMNYHIPAITETISINMAGTFEYNYKILITYPLIMAISQYLIIKLYLFVSELQGNIFISIVLTYIITGLIYTVIFYLLSYINILTIKESIFIGLTTYIIGLIITIFITLFITIIINSKKVAR